MATGSYGEVVKVIYRTRRGLLSSSPLPSKLCSPGCQSAASQEPKEAARPVAYGCGTVFSGHCGSGMRGGKQAQHLEHLHRGPRKSGSPATLDCFGCRLFCVAGAALGASVRCSTWSASGETMALLSFLCFSSPFFHVPFPFTLFSCFICVSPCFRYAAGKPTSLESFSEHPLIGCV